jgi:hypothetical protein
VRLSSSRGPRRSPAGRNPRRFVDMRKFAQCILVGAGLSTFFESSTSYADNRGVALSLRGSFDPNGVQFPGQVIVRDSTVNLVVGNIGGVFKVFAVSPDGRSKCNTIKNMQDDVEERFNICATVRRKGGNAFEINFNSGIRFVGGHLDAALGAAADVAPADQAAVLNLTISDSGCSAHLRVGKAISKDGRSLPLYNDALTCEPIRR